VFAFPATKARSDGGLNAFSLSEARQWQDDVAMQKINLFLSSSGRWPGCKRALHESIFLCAGQVDAQPL
jgi:hypothetical protein